MTRANPESACDGELGIVLRERALILIIQREFRSNALSRGLLERFARLRVDWPHYAEARAIIITGAGERAFCAGADLIERRTMNDDEIRRQLRQYQSSLGWLGRRSVPLVAAINGACLGGGLELALLCDLRISAAHASFGLPETGLGVIPGAGGTQRLPRVIGEARAKELILLGRRLTAPEALEVGLVNRVCDAGANVLEQALDWIRPILDGAPVAQGAALHATRRALSLPLAAGLALERELYQRCLATEDRQEALRAFAEKRPPVFRGR